jgi:Zn finger protein HypA/HybF involved in hydrogenase expression
MLTKPLGVVMDNKYGLGSSKVAVELHKKKDGIKCRNCDNSQLHFCPTMQDHQCEKCGEWQNDIPNNYSTGRSTDY